MNLLTLLRLVKAGLLGQVALFALLVGYDNLVDYQANYAFVQHVLSMDSLPADMPLLSRAIHDPLLYRLGYALIIAGELLAGLLCGIGSLRLLAACRAPAATFRAAKAFGLLGLFCGFSLWFFGFMVLGAEWFQMWQSATWNGQEGAFRFIVCLALVLLFLMQEEPAAND